ncbi:hypothetical protein DFH06DRAFT_302985 [Mycena polygramma]|nr:hypothetical protein DFH06DRAFT_302985 [Mycena polygramma]
MGRPSWGNHRGSCGNAYSGDYQNAEPVSPSQRPAGRRVSGTYLLRTYHHHALQLASTYARCGGPRGKLQTVGLLLFLAPLCLMFSHSRRFLMRNLFALTSINVNSRLRRQFQIWDTRSLLIRKKTKTFCISPASTSGQVCPPLLEVPSRLVLSGLSLRVRLSDSASLRHRADWWQLHRLGC